MTDDERKEMADMFGDSTADFQAAKTVDPINLGMSVDDMLFQMCMDDMEQSFLEDEENL